MDADTDDGADTSARASHASATALPPTVKMKSAYNTPSPSPTRAPTPAPRNSVDSLLLGQKTPHSGVYIPRIYGFRVSEFAHSGPRMQWLRMRPHSSAELES